MANPSDPFVEMAVAIALSALMHMAKAWVGDEMREGGAWTAI